MNGTNSVHLGRFAAGLRFGDLPTEVVEKAKEIFRHVWAVQLAGSTYPWSKAIARYGRSRGGVPESTVIAHGWRTSMENAAYLNSSFTGLELNDNYGPVGIKGGCVVVPASLAVAESRLRTGKELVTAIVAGFEVMTRVGLTVRDGVWERGVHPTGGLGSFGAAAAAACLLGADDLVAAHAIDGASATPVGLLASPPTGRGHVKRIYPGEAAAAGIRSAMLAGDGLTGSLVSLEEGSGFLRAFGATSGTALTAGLGTEWQILRVHYPRYAQDAYIAPMTEAVARIRAEHTFAVDDVAEVRLGTNRVAYRDIIGPIKDPQDLTDAQFSANFSIALFLITGGAGFGEYTEENLWDAAIRKLSSRVVLGVDDEIDAEHEQSRTRGATVTIRLTSGAEFSERVRHIGAVSDEDLQARFRDLTARVLGDRRSEEFLSIAESLEEVQDVGVVARSLVR